MHQGSVRLEKAAAVIGRFPLLIVGIWILAAVALNLAASSPQRLILENSKAPLPTDTLSADTMARMSKDFHMPASTNQSMVVIEKKTTFDDADREFRKELMRRLVADKAHVASVFDTWSDPQMASFAESPDKKLTFLQINLAGDLGSPQSIASVQAVQQIVDHTAKPSGTSVYVSGLSQGVVDQVQILLREVVLLGLASALLIGALLFVVYRSLTVAVLPLLTFGLAAGVGVPFVGILIASGVLPASMFTDPLQGALMLGTGTDYAIFLIGRYQEERRKGRRVDDAYRSAYRGIAPVIAASGLTVAAGLSCMGLTQMELFHTIAFPCAIGMLLSVASALTVTPAVLYVGAKRFGLFEPRAARAGSRPGTTLWRKVGVLVARWPAPIFVSTSAVLILLITVIPTAEFNFDEIAFVPKEAPSSHGLAAMQRHFPAAQISPEFVLVEADHDLRNSADIGEIERAAAKLSKLPSVSMVQWLTRPLGAPLDQASLTYGAGAAGTLFAQNVPIVKQRLEQLRKFADDANRMIASIDNVQGLIARSRQQIQSVNASTAQIRSGLLIVDTRARQLTALLDPVQKGVDGESDCEGNTLCATVQSALSDYAAVRGLSEKTEQLSRTTDTLGANLTSTDYSLPLIAKQLANARDMAISVNAAIAPLLDQLDMATSLMQDLGKSSAGTGAYFYFPAQILGNPRIKPYLGLLFSPDGKATRLIVMGTTSGFTIKGVKRAEELQNTMAEEFKGTRLEGSVISVGGVAPLAHDLHEILGHDTKIILVSAMVVIFTIVLFLLRSIVAALIVVASATLSFGSTLGASLVVWQYLFGIQLHWSIPLVVFAILISVGADYNLLVASRFKEEAQTGAGIRTGVIRAVAGTGGVVTTAGMVFAMTMFVMTGSSLLTAAQIGFTIGMGLVIDTFIVRTFTVPTLAVLLGEKFWWPLRLQRPAARAH